MARGVRRALAAAGLAVFAMTVTAPASPAAVAPSMTAATVASVQPVNGQTVGVAHPIVVTFTKPVVDRIGAERSIVVSSPENMSGTFEWRSDNVVAWTPDRYWPAHSQISLMAGGMKRNFGKKRIESEPISRSCKRWLTFPWRFGPLSPWELWKKPMPWHHSRAM